MSSPATSVVCARVLAGDIEVGDRVARRRSQEFLAVVRLRRLVATVRLEFEDGSIDWPRQEAFWWCQVGPDIWHDDEGVWRRIGPHTHGPFDSEGDAVAFTPVGPDLRVGPAAS